MTTWPTSELRRGVLIGWKRREDKESGRSPEDKDEACEWGSADELLVFEAAEYIALDARRDTYLRSDVRTSRYGSG